MEIIKGKIPTAQRVLIYGPEGIGKTTLAAQFPGAVFIDTEGSSRHMDVARLPDPSSMAHLIEEINWAAEHPDDIGTLVIDTADWAESLARAAVIAADPTGKVKSIEDYGYGKGYVYVWENFGRVLQALDRVIKAGVHVVLTAHAAIRKFEQPGDLGSYDRWELKLQNSPKANICAMLKEWADMVLFCNYEVTTFKNDEKKTKAVGGQRVIYTTHAPSYDAKNRHGLPEKLEMSFESIRRAIEENTPKRPQARVKTQKVKEPAPAKAEPQSTPEEFLADIGAPFEIIDDEPAPVPNLPKALLDLMAANNITADQIQQAVAFKGYMPADMPVEKYPQDFVEGCLIGAWPSVLEVIRSLNRDNIIF